MKPRAGLGAKYYRPIRLLIVGHTASMHVSGEYAATGQR